MTQRENKVNIARAQAALPRYRQVVRMRDSGMTFTQIGSILGVSKQQAHRLYVRANETLNGGTP